jgi:hypothetical protein
MVNIKWESRDKAHQNKTKGKSLAKSKILIKNLQKFCQLAAPKNLSGKKLWILKFLNLSEIFSELLIGLSPVKF